MLYSNEIVYFLHNKLKKCLKKKFFVFVSLTMQKQTNMTVLTKMIKHEQKVVKN